MSEFVESGWRDLLMVGKLSPEAMHPAARVMSNGFRLLPGHPRCQLCNAPFQGRGAAIASAFGVRPSSFSMRVCARCEGRARGDKTGAQVDVVTLFADIRGSTRISRELGAERFRDLIDRFYTTATEILIGQDAMIEQLVGDQVASLFVPGLAGATYAKRAVDAAVALQSAFGASGHGDPWLPVGIGVDAGEAFVGVVGTIGGLTELTVLGDVPNRTGRLAAHAATGEILVTDAALQLSGVTATTRRSIEAKGFNTPIQVGVLTADSLS